MMPFSPSDHPHRRYNPLLDEWVLVSPHRAKRPWQGQQESVQSDTRPAYDPGCYLCPGNMRANGEHNPNYEGIFTFNNDFPSLLTDAVEPPTTENLFRLQPERGINKVICFSPRHDLTLAEMDAADIAKVVAEWQKQYNEIGQVDYIRHVQIFENKGAVMGCSNPHPHGQIWAQSDIPSLVHRTQQQLRRYYDQHQRSLLADYLADEIRRSERMVYINEHFAVVVPFWAVWPYETMIISKRHVTSLADLAIDEINGFADAISVITIKYDNLFCTSFPYSSGIHQAPTDAGEHPEWHLHMHFYPPLLRSATVRKFMVGYEMLGEAQRDLTPEQSAQRLRELPVKHYRKS